MNNLDRKKNTTKSMCLIITGVDMLIKDPECLEILENGIKEAKTRTAVNRVFKPAEHPKIRELRAEETILQAIYDLCKERKRQTVGTEKPAPVRLETKHLRRIGAY